MSEAPQAASPPAPAPRAKPDRWAHRRTEPRPLAFLWTSFLAVASAVTLVTLVTQGATGHDAYRPAAQSLFAVMGAGLCLLWPMLRLSQPLAPRPVGAAVAKDIAVLITPAQAVLWPQAMFFLAAWPLEVIGACSAILAAWTLLVGAVLSAALAHVGLIESSRAGRTAAAPRALWTLAIVALVSAGPLLGLGAPAPTGAPGTTRDANLAMLASPVTAMLEITSPRPWSGQAAAALPVHWRAVGVTSALAVLAWVAGSGLRRRYARSLPPPTGPGGPDGIQTSESNPLHSADTVVTGSGSAETGGVTPPHGSDTMELVTKADRETVEKRLADLIANRPVITQRIAEARAHGDLRENGDYHAAREQQGIDEAEIRRLEQRLANMTVIDEGMAKAVEGLVVVGSTVRLRDVDDNDTDLFKLVGEASNPPPADYVEVTVTSPMGEALLKSRVGDTIRVNAPRGVKRFEIIEIL